MIARPQDQAAGRPTNATPFRNGIDLQRVRPLLQRLRSDFCPFGRSGGHQTAPLGTLAVDEKIRPPESSQVGGCAPCNLSS